MSEYVHAGSAVIEGSTGPWVRDKLREAQARIEELDEEGHILHAKLREAQAEIEKLNREAKGLTDLSLSSSGYFDDSEHPERRISQRRSMPDRRARPYRRTGPQEKDSRRLYVGHGRRRHIERRQHDS